MFGQSTYPFIRLKKGNKENNIEIFLIKELKIFMMNIQTGVKSSGGIVKVGYLVTLSAVK